MPEAPISDKAMSLVGPINKAYADLKLSYRTSLTHALDLGNLLVVAHGAVGKKRWKAYLEDNCDLSYRTATVYMQLAKHRAEFDDPAKVQHAALLGTADDLSIRGALAAVVNPKPENPSPRTPRTPTTSAAVSPPEPSVGSVDLTTLLRNSAVDEITKAMQDAEVYDEVIKPSLVEQIKVTPLSYLVTALTEAYDTDRLQDLIKDLQNRLRPTFKRTFLDQQPTQQ